MLLSVTLNPLLEHRFFVNNFKVNSDIRAFAEDFKTGGKGININRQLNFLGIENLAITFSGGYNGKKFRSILNQENINNMIVPTKSETRIASVIIDESSNLISTVFGINSVIEASEIEEFTAKLEKAVQNCSIVVFSGSIPNDDSADIIIRGLQLADKYDKISILDTYGSHFLEFIENSPTILHNNLSEIELSLNTNLNNENEIRDLLNYFYSKNIKQSYLTNSGNDFYCSNFDFHHKVKIPHIKSRNETGSGDAFVSGLIYGLSNSMTFKNTVKFAVSLAAANAEELDVCSVKKENSDRYSEKVEIIEIGKKISLIDGLQR